MPAIFSTPEPANALDDDVYLATVTEMSLVTEIKNGQRVPVVSEYGKKKFEVVVTLDEVDDENGQPVKLRRRFAESWGTNRTTGAPSGLVAFLAVASGMAPTDKAIRHLMTEDVVGKKVRVQTTTVEREGATYVNIAAFLPLPKRQATKPAPITQQAIDEAPLDEEVPF